MYPSWPCNSLSRNQQLCIPPERRRGRSVNKSWEGVGSEPLINEPQTVDTALTMSFPEAVWKEAFYGGVWRRVAVARATHLHTAASGGLRRRHFRRQIGRNLDSSLGPPGARDGPPIRRSSLGPDKANRAARATRRLIGRPVMSRRTGRSHFLSRG
ncbi:hypothetical protein BaRGS_00003953, partial [Batillaria attramentaria]